MAFDYSKFATDIGMSAEDKAALDGLFGKYATAATKIDEFVSAEVASRLTPLQADLDQKKADLDAQFETLELVRSGDSTKLDEALAEVEKAKAKVAVAEERIKRVATDAGLDPTPFLKDLAMAQPTEPAKPTAPAGVDLAKLAQQSGLQAWNALNSAAELQDIAQEHFALFKTPLTNSRELLTKLADRVKRTGNNQLGLRDIWTDEYKVEAKREELRTAEVTAKVNEAYERGKREAADAAALGTAQGQEPPQFRPTSPIHAALDKDAKPTMVNGVPEGVAAAMKTYRSLVQQANRVA